MKTFTTAAIVVAALALTACAGSPVALSTSADQRASASNAQLCAGAAISGMNSATGEEIARRGFLTDRERDAIGRKTVFVGMTKDAVLCSWGTPDDTRRVTTASGSADSFIYREGLNGRLSNIVYFNNGIVTAIGGK